VNIQSAVDNQDIHQTASRGSGEDDWILEAQRRRGHSIKKQWEVASQLRVFPGRSQIRWGDLCRISACGDKKYYETERERQRHYGKLDEDKRTKAVENLVPQGICGWGVDLIKDFVNNPEVVKELHSSSHDDCPTCSVEEFATSLSKAVHEECFDSCAAHLDEIVEGLPCADHENSPANWTQVFEQAVQGDEQCGTLPPDTLMELAEYRMVRRCMDWHAPSLLWVMNDRGVDIAASQHAVCKMLPFDKPFSTSPEEIYQSGACPEGTACDCPEKWVNKHLSLAERRDRRFSLFFVTPGSAIIPSIFNYVRKNIAVKAMVAAFLMVTPLSPMLPLTVLKFVMSTTWRGERVYGVVTNAIKADKSFRCAQTAGCWAVPPMKKKMAHRSTSCRMSESAAAGSSPVWFLPPPMMKVEKRFQRCSMKPCNELELSSQKVGFGGKENKSIYNCQPLIWEDMGETQQTRLKEVLRQTGVDEEYSL